MFSFKLEPESLLLTATRTGSWSCDTVAAYERALRAELAIIRSSGGPTAFIMDIRSSVPQEPDVADELRAMVRRLGPLHADRTAVVTSRGVAKLQARRAADDNAQVFTSMVLARDWATRQGDRADKVHDQPSDAEAEAPAVHVHGPSDIDVLLTPTAALETAKRIGDAAVEALLASSARTAVLAIPR